MSIDRLHLHRQIGLRSTSSLKRRKNLQNRISFLFLEMELRTLPVCRISLLKIPLWWLVTRFFISTVNQHNNESFFFSQTGQTVSHIIKLSSFCWWQQISRFPLTVDYSLIKAPSGLVFGQSCIVYISVNFLISSNTTQGRQIPKN